MKTGSMLAMYEMFARTRHAVQLFGIPLLFFPRAILPRIHSPHQVFLHPTIAWPKPRDPPAQRARRQSRTVGPISAPGAPRTVASPPAAERKNFARLPRGSDDEHQGKQNYLRFDSGMPGVS
jgi:hypothetical protein